MSTYVSLEECTFTVYKMDQYQQGKFCLELKLPRRLDLTDITPERNSHASSHDFYPGSAGTMKVVCGGRALFDTREYIEKSSDRPSFRFQSVPSGMTWHHFQKFELTGLDFLLRDVAGESNRDKILEAIKSDDELAQYLQRFFEWINEFIKTHGGEHYYNPQRTLPIRA